MDNVDLRPDSAFEILSRAAKLVAESSARALEASLDTSIRLSAAVLRIAARAFDSVSLRALRLAPALKKSVERTIDAVSLTLVRPFNASVNLAARAFELVSESVSMSARIAFRVVAVRAVEASALLVLSLAALLAQAVR